MVSRPEAESQEEEVGQWEPGDIPWTADTDPWHGKSFPQPRARPPAPPPPRRQTETLGAPGQMSASRAQNSGTGFPYNTNARPFFGAVSLGEERARELPAHRVIHDVPPVWDGSKPEKPAMLL